MTRRRAGRAAGAVVAAIGILAWLPGAARATGTPALVPYLGCPGVSQPLYTTGFAPGTYDLSSTYMTFNPTTLTVRPDGTRTAVTVVIHNDAPATFDADATPTGADTPYVSKVHLVTPPVSWDWRGNSYDISGRCFGPGDAITIATAGATAQAPSSVVADANGNITFSASFTAISNAQTASVTATDSASGRASATVPIPIPGTTLRVGAQLLPRTYDAIASPTMAYGLHLILCNADESHYYVSNGLLYSPSVWSAAGSGSNCRLHVLSTGDLVLDDAVHGTRYWHTGTSNTGSDNRLIVQSNGDLVLDTAASHPVWSSRIGLIRGSNGYVTRASIGAARHGSTVDVSGTVRQFNINGTLVPAVRRHVELQRLVGRSWRRYLSATTNSTGHIQFSFRQPTTYRYRLYAPITSTAAATWSASVRR